ncbi:MAG: DUF4097 family beta strand repeat-containing protein [Bacillota bacterium]
MKLAIKILAAIVIIGVLLGAVGLIIIASQYGSLSAFFDAENDYVKYEQTLYDIPNEIVVNADNRMIKIQKNNEENVYMSYYEGENDIVTYNDNNDSLSIDAEQDQDIFWFFNFNFRRVPSEKRTITIKVPQTFEGSLDIRTLNGAITVDDLATIESAELRTSNGAVTVEKVSIEKSSRLKSKNGAITARNVSCHGVLRMETSNGKVKGYNVVASRLEGKSSNGSIDLDRIDSSNIEGVTSNGSVDIKIKGEMADYEIRVASNLGNISIDGVGYSNQTINSGASKRVRASSSTGSISIDFE